jgi:hypothetical protein
MLNGTQSSSPVRFIIPQMLHAETQAVQNWEEGAKDYKASTPPEFTETAGTLGFNGRLQGEFASLMAGNKVEYV